MTDLGRTLLIVGVVVALLGAAMWGLGRAGFRGLPGDLRYEGESVRFYFPIVTSLVLSVLLTLGFWAWRWLSGR